MEKREKGESRVEEMGMANQATPSSIIQTSKNPLNMIPYLTNQVLRLFYDDYLWRRGSTEHLLLQTTSSSTNICAWDFILSIKSSEDISFVSPCNNEPSQSSRCG